MAEIIHPFYEAHRGAMEAAMRHRLDLAEAVLCERAHLSDIDGIRQAVMDEFEIVLTQMPYVGGAASRMSDFFMGLIGFMAISRVLLRHGVSLSVIGDIERETYKAQLLTVPEGFEAQCEQAWRNVIEVLTAAGLRVGHLVKVTTFLTDRNQVVTNRAIRRAMLGEHQPALTVMIAETVDSKWLLEIEAIAAE